MKLTGKDGAVVHFLMMIEVRNYSPNTLDRYRYALSVLTRHLESLCDIKDLEAVTVFHLRKCVQHLMTTPIEADKSSHSPARGKIMSASSVTTLISVWKVFFNWCSREELIEKNPVTRLEFPKVPKKVIPSFSDVQIQSMVDVFDLSTEEGFRDYIIVLLLVDTGIRRSEVSSLCVDDVQVDYIRVHGKGRKERFVGISPELSTLIWKYIHKYRHPKNPDETALSLSTKTYPGLPFRRGAMDALINRLKVATGIDNVRFSPHTFRHTHAKMYLEEGGDIFSLSRELGHSDIKTTQRYLESFSSDNARKSHNKFTPLNRVKMRTKSKGGKKKKS